MGTIIASAESTGSAGASFEQHVGAYWLAFLLTQACCPFDHNAYVTEVTFQTKYLGYHTDDLLVRLKTEDASIRFVIQAKRNFRLSKSNEECKKTIIGFWKDYSNHELFDANRDRLILAVQQPSDKLLKHFGRLLEIAKASNSHDDFMNRQTTPGALSKDSIEYYNEIARILENHCNSRIDSNSIWNFIRSIHLQRMDLGNDSATDNAQVNNLLAQTSNQQDPRAAAAQTWNALIVLTASRGMPHSTVITYETLPSELKSAHDPVASFSKTIMLQATSHAKTILDNISSHISTDNENIHFERSVLIEKAFDELSQVQVLLIQAPGGYGKSALATSILEKVKSKPVVAFRASEFISPHFDNLLSAANINCTADRFFNTLRMQKEKYLYIDGFERLLENSERKALDDLLMYLSMDKSFKTIITCRDYGAERLKNIFFENRKIETSILNISKLDREEVLRALPLPVAQKVNEKLLEILCIPYYLRLFFSVKWSQTLPESFHEFKNYVWEKGIRGDKQADRIHIRREDIAISIAHKRALNFTEYTLIDTQDFQAIDCLIQESIIVTNPQNDRQVKLSHDVMEDWALGKLLENEYQENISDPAGFIASLSMHPALRRAYKVWLNEYIERHPSESMELYRHIHEDITLPAHLKDDTYVALIQSTQFPEYAQRNKAELFKNNNELLLRFVRLLLLSCITYNSLIPMPIGGSWETFCQLTEESIKEFKDKDLHLIRKMISIWTNQVTLQNPYPRGADSAASIICFLSEKSARYDQEFSDLIELLCKIPLARNSMAVSYLTSKLNEPHNNDNVYRVIFDSLATTIMSRDVPEFVIELFFNRILIKNRNNLPSYEMRGDDYHYGIEMPYDTLGMPASAFRGPFLWLLKFHNSLGLRFILKLIDHSTEWNVTITNERYTSVPVKTVLPSADGNIEHWMNEPLWMAYRGIVVFPEPLQSALMALEHFLLDMVDIKSENYDVYLSEILASTKSAAVASVVASCCCANMKTTTNTLLTLLHNKDYLLLDFKRAHRECQVIDSSLMGFSRNALDPVYYNERQRSKERNHRAIDLQTAALYLQYHGKESEIQQIIDKYLRDIGSSESDEDITTWRMALARMDARKLRISSITEDGIICLEAANLDDDLREKSAQVHKEMHGSNEKTRFYLWARKVMEDKCSEHDRQLWRAYFEKYKLEFKSIPEDADDSSIYDLIEFNGFVTLVFISIRDHWEELEPGEISWCIDVLLSAIEHHCNDWGFIETIQKQPDLFDRVAACALPVAYMKSSDENICKRVFFGMILSATHAIAEVRLLFCNSLSANCDNKVILEFLSIINSEALLYVKNTKWKKFFYQYGQSFDVIGYATAIRIRNKIKRGNVLERADIFNLSLYQWIALPQFKQILDMSYKLTADAAISSFFERIVQFFLEDWSASNDSTKQRCQYYHQVDYAKHRLIDYFLNIDFEQTKSLLMPFLSSADRFSSEIGDFIALFFAKAYNKQKLRIFWDMWDFIADVVLENIHLSSESNERYYSEKKIVAALFLDPLLGSDISSVHDELDLHGSKRMADLFNRLPITTLSLSNYVKYLYFSGKESFPNSFKILSERLLNAEYTVILSDSNTIYLLERILRRQLYADGSSIKSNPAIREHILRLFDLLVECGSSQAYFMRDDFALPSPI